MRLLVLRSAWGLTNIRRSVHDAFQGVSAAGFDGIEASLSDLGNTPTARAAAVAAARDVGLRLIISAYSSWNNYEGEFDAGTPLDGHADQLVRELREIAELHQGCAASPVLGVNCHSGSGQRLC